MTWQHNTLHNDMTACHMTTWHIIWWQHDTLLDHMTILHNTWWLDNMTHYMIEWLNQNMTYYMMTWQHLKCRVAHVRPACVLYLYFLLAVRLFIIGGCRIVLHTGTLYSVQVTLWGVCHMLCVICHLSFASFHFIWN